jgi:hypothetical protein
MNTAILLAAILFGVAIFLMVFTMIISWLKSLQKERFKNWTFLDYISVGYLRHLFLKYIKRQ